MKEKKQTLITKCPQCHKSVVYNSKNKYRPFCGRACYSQDLIQWHDEGYAIKGPPSDESDLLGELQKRKREDF